MPRVTPPPGDERLRRIVGRAPAVPPRLVALLALPAVVLAGVCYWWFVQRVEVPADQVLVLIRKVGAPLPAEGPDGELVSQQVVLYPALLERLGAKDRLDRYKGIVYAPLAEGRYFFDPLFWERRLYPAVNIAQEEIGIKVRKYGRPLPPGKTVATEPDERGPEVDWLQPGRHNLNPLAYDVLRVKPVVIPPGHVGVQTLYHGKDPQDPNRYVVDTGERGVQPDVLPPGMYYNNPYVRRIDAIDVRSHTLDLRGADCIRFPSNDSFEILVDCTVEYAIRQDLAPYVLVAIGVHDDIRDKLILPYVRSLCRIEGSKLQARDFIAGETRSVFQKRLFDGLRQQCDAQGIEIRSALIRRIVPPQEIAGPISDRQLAEQQIRQYENEISLALSEAKLVEQQEMQKQNQAIGQANREVVAVVKEAEQQKAVALTEAQQRLAVAKLNLEAARETAAALLARGQAEAEVRLLQYQAEAEPLRAAIAAYGSGEAYAQFFFYQRLAPALKSVLASTEGPFADIFRVLAPERPVTGALTKGGQP